MSTHKIHFHGEIRKMLCGYPSYLELYTFQGSFNTDLLAEHSTSFRLTCLAVYNKSTASHNNEEDNDAVTLENSERTNKVDKKKNKKRNISLTEEGTEVEEEEKDIDSEIPLSKKIKKSGEPFEHSKMKQKKKNKSKQMKKESQQQRTGR